MVVVVAVAVPASTAVVVFSDSSSCLDSLAELAAAAADMLALAFDLAALDLPPPLALPAALAFMFLPSRLCQAERKRSILSQRTNVGSSNEDVDERKK